MERGEKVQVFIQSPKGRMKIDLRHRRSPILSPDDYTEYYFTAAIYDTDDKYKIEVCSETENGLALLILRQCGISNSI